MLFFVLHSVLKAHGGAVGTHRGAVGFYSNTRLSLCTTSS